MEAHYRRTHERQGVTVEGHMVHRRDAATPADPVQVHRDRQAANRVRDAADTLAASTCALCSQRPAEGEKDGIPLCVGCYLDVDAATSHAVHI